MNLAQMSLVLMLGSAPASASAQAPAVAVVAQDDEAAIRGIVADLEADKPSPHVSPKLDWENAFGIRYGDLKKRDAFYDTHVRPQFKDATEKTLEVNIQFVTGSVAVADTYWHVAGQVYSGETKPGPDRWGRTTYVFRKEDGQWTEIIERVADLRLPYYKHLQAVPPAAAIPTATLDSYAGHYSGRSADVDVARSGDHLTLTTKRGTMIAIPVSATDFLVFFSADDPAQYYKASFSAQDGAPQYTLSEAWGEELGVFQKSH